MTADKINRSVAEAMGAHCVVEGGLLWSFPDAVRHCYLPDYSIDAAAADLLKAHMRAQGWHYRSGWGTDGGFAYVDTREPHHCIGESYAQKSEEIALCLAFLAACEASKEVGSDTL